MIHIGESFTRLEPATCFVAVNLQEHRRDCVLPEPPQAFASVHSRALVNEWHARLLRGLADPVCLERRQGHRRVSLLGAVIFDLDSEQHCKVYQWVMAERGWVILDPLPDAQVALTDTPLRSLWMHPYQVGAVRVLRRGHPGQARLCNRYADWVARSLAQLVWTREAQAHVRESLAKALNLDQKLLAIGCQLAQEVQQRRWLTVDRYNAIVADREALGTLHRETPKLLSLYALLAKQSGSELDAPVNAEEVTAALRTWVLCRSLQPALWRLLCRAGTGWMHGLLVFYKHSLPPAQRVADLLRVAQAFGTQRLAPTWMMHAAMQLCGTANSPKSCYADSLEDLFPLCARLGHVYPQLDAEQRALLEARCADIFSWADACLDTVPARTLRHASLPWLLRQVDNWRIRSRLEHQGRRCWDIPWAPIDLGPGDIYAVYLTTPLAVWEEGRAMSHCADRFIPRCAKRELVMVSIRSRTQRRPQVTVSIDMTCRLVRVHQMAGFANQKLATAQLRWVGECRRQLQAQVDEVANWNDYVLARVRADEEAEREQASQMGRKS